MKKHQPNLFNRYKEIHDTVMEKYRRSGFVRADNLEFRAPARGYIKLCGRIECAGWIYIAVEKNLRILKGTGASATIQTETYSYNVVLEGEGNIVRYDGPHRHRLYHHVHRFDSFERDGEGTVAFLTGDEQPTLGEVIGEVQGWLYDNIDEVTRRRVGDT